jgi:hypothetical protein
VSRPLKVGDQVLVLDHDVVGLVVERLARGLYRIAVTSSYSPVCEAVRRRDQLDLL